MYSALAGACEEIVTQKGITRKDSKNEENFKYGTGTYFGNLLGRM